MATAARSNQHNLDDEATLHGVERIATAQSQHALHLTLSQQTTISLPDVLPPATAGNQIPAEERARILAERRRRAGAEDDGPSPKPRGFARILAAFKHPKTSAGNTFGKWTVTYGGGAQIQGDRGVYGGLM